MRGYIIHPRGNMNTIYVEQIFFDNFIMDFIVLFLTARILGIKRNIKYILLGAAVGGVYAACCIQKVMAVFIVKMAMSVVICFITFGKGSWKLQLMRLSVFLIVSFAIGGAVFGLNYMIAPKLSVSGLGSVPIRLIVFGIAIGMGVIEIYSRGTGRDLFESCCKTTINMVLFGEKIVLKGFMDTGNSLRDEFTGDGVIIADKNAILKQLSEQAKERAHMLFNFTPLEETTRVFLINTATGSDVIPALKPEYMIIRINGRKFNCNSYIAFADSINGDGYSAILGPWVKLTAA